MKKFSALLVPSSLDTVALCIALVVHTVIAVISWMMPATRPMIAVSCIVQICVQGLRIVHGKNRGPAALTLAALVTMTAAAPMAMVGRAALTTHVITWSFDASGRPSAGRPNDIAPEVLVNQLSGQINDPQGWRRAGIAFKYVATQGDITFRAESSKALQKACPLPDRLITLGCTTPGGIGTCTIQLGYNYDPAKSTYFAPSEAVVNHELGHCLGLDHSHGGLMNPVVTATSYPSFTQVWLARVHLS